MPDGGYMREAGLHQGSGGAQAHLTAAARTAAGSLARGPGAPLPSTFVYGAGFVGGWWLHTIQPLFIDINGASMIQTGLGVALLAFGAGLFFWGMWTFSHEQTGIMPRNPASHVVMSGPYRWSRNPMYVGFTALYLGFAFLMNMVWPVLLLPGVLLILFAAVIAREERYMRATFGEAYDSYCRRVPRWL
jgi:protein-S-isoprenylcysteine O-methyltransferase Ste14